MDAISADTFIRDEAGLAAIYGESSQGAISKEIAYIHPHYRAMIEASPFMVLATSGPEGLDCSPRGDPPGSFVQVLDEKTLLIPDRRGNNRIDSLRNIVRDPRVALLFLIPGVGETLRCERHRGDLGRTRTDRAVSVPQHAASHGHRRHGGKCIFSMSKSIDPLGTVESGKACRAGAPAQHR